jgi:predicted glycosyltransferase
MNNPAHKPKVMIWSEAVTASGHIRMTNRLSKAMQDKGFDVVIVTSGHAADMVRSFGDFGNAKVVELPSLKPQGDFDPKNPESFFNALTPNGKRYEDDLAFQQERRDTLIKTFNEEKPDIVITEHWPIGRRKYDAEMIPFLDHVVAHNAAHPENKTKILGYMRDATGAPELGAPKEYVAGVLNKYFDRILVRGDPRVVKLDETLGEHISTLGNKVSYAGYPVDVKKKNLLDRVDKTADQVVVSCGGGYQPDATQYYLDVLASRSHSKLANKTWHIFVNNECSQEDFERIAEAAKSAKGQIIVERENDSFGKHLQNCALAIVRGGMTVSEVASAGKPCVVVPRMVYPNHPQDNEQFMRAYAFEQRFSNIKLALPEILASPNDMGNTIDMAYAMRRGSQPGLLGNGQYNAASMMLDWHKGVPMPACFGQVKT